MLIVCHYEFKHVYSKKLPTIFFCFFLQVIVISNADILQDKDNVDGSLYFSWNFEDRIIHSLHFQFLRLDLCV